MKRSSFRSVVLSCLISLSAGLAAPSWAASYFSCGGEPRTWESDRVNFYVRTGSFPDNSADRRSLDRAVAAWNSNSPGNRFRFATYSHAGNAYRSGDGYNSILATNDFGWSTGTLAATLIRFQTCAWFYDGSIVETDILFNPNVAWNKSTRPRAGQLGTSMTLVATHELGHAMGLAHSDWLPATMNSFHPNGGPLGNRDDPDPHADDAYGARLLYNDFWASATDVSATAYRLGGLGVSREIPAPSSARRGSRVTFQYTVGNRGRYPLVNLPVNFYLSTNRWISTADRLIGQTAVTLSPGAEITRTVTFTVPWSVARGYYYLGWVADPTNALYESDEDNNGVALTRSTRID